MEKKKYLTIQYPADKGIKALEDYLNEMNQNGYSFHTMTVLSLDTGYCGSAVTKFFVCIFEEKGISA